MCRYLVLLPTLYNISIEKLIGLKSSKGTNKNKICKCSYKIKLQMKKKLNKFKKLKVHKYIPVCKTKNFKELVYINTCVRRFTQRTHVLIPMGVINKKCK